MFDFLPEDLSSKGTSALAADARVLPSNKPALPNVGEVLRVTQCNNSFWAQASRIDARHQDGTESSYFMKVSQGHHGREALRGEFEATSAICSITPDFCPKSIAWSTLANSPDSHFYLCRFYDFAGGIPEPIGFCEKLARLHQAQVSPSGKFGFHCTTYNGDLPQDNTWSNNWETFFANGLRHVLRVREERAGPNSELDELLPALFENVIPRLLRPMESNGRKLQPSLVHSDLWYGNAAITDSETNEGIVFDPAHFWAHNEYELGNWRPKRNKFSDSYFDAYHKIMPKTEPVEDYDDRNALYALRFNLHAATLFPGDASYLQSVIDEIRRLAQKYPEGYVDDKDVSLPD